jgi:hypothetical protein
MRDFLSNLSSVMSRIFQSFRVVTKFVNGFLVGVVEITWETLVDLSVLPVNALHAINGALFGNRASAPEQAAQEASAGEEQQQKRQERLNSVDSERDGLKAIQITAWALANGREPGQEVYLLSKDVRAHLGGLRRDELAIVAASGVGGLIAIRDGKPLRGVRSRDEVGPDQDTAAEDEEISIDFGVVVPALRRIIEARFRGKILDDADIYKLPYSLQEAVLTAPREDFQTLWSASDDRLKSIIESNIRNAAADQSCSTMVTPTKPVPGVAWHHEVNAFKQCAHAKVRGVHPGTGALSLLRPELQAHLKNTDTDTLDGLTRQTHDQVSNTLNAVLNPPHRKAETAAVDRSEAEQAARKEVIRAAWRAAAARRENPELDEDGNELDDEGMAVHA